MAYDEALADRVLTALSGRDGVTERRMFGGVGFMLRGNLCCGVHGGNLIVRLGAEDGERALGEPHTRPFDLTGRALTGWVYVEPPALETDSGLQAWIERAVSYVEGLPPK